MREKTQNKHGNKETRHRRPTFIQPQAGRPGSRRSQEENKTIEEGRHMYRQNKKTKTNSKTRKRSTEPTGERGEKEERRKEEKKSKQKSHCALVQIHTKRQRAEGKGPLQDKKRNLGRIWVGFFFVLVGLAVSLVGFDFLTLCLFFM